MSVELSPLVHIEIVVPDAEDAYRFLHEAFGARKVQQELAAFLTAETASAESELPALRVIHVGLGDVVLQFVEPLAEEGPWYEQLRETGAGVHNLTFLVDDIEETVQELGRKGVSPLLSFPLDWGRLAGPENVRRNARPVYMMDTREKIGFHLELTETPWKEPHAVQPAKYATGSDELIGKVSPMLHIELTVPDAEGAFRFLRDGFGTRKVEKEFAAFLDSEFMRVVHVNLSNVVLQYCQPLQQQGSWYEQLRAGGPGVHNLTFVVDAMEDTVKRIEAAGEKNRFEFSLDWSRLIDPGRVRSAVSPVHMFDTMKRLGFRLELGERPSEEELDFLFIDYR